MGGLSCPVDEMDEMDTVDKKQRQRKINQETEVRQMKVIDAVKQLLDGNRKFPEADADAGQEAADILNAVTSALKDEAVKEANDGVKKALADLEEKEAAAEAAVDAAKAEADTTLATERARTVGALKDCRPLGLGTEDALGVLGPQKDGNFLDLASAKDRLIALAGEKNGALETPDGRKQTPVENDDVAAEKALHGAVARLKEQGR